MFSVVVEIIWIFFSKSISVRWSQISLEQNVNESYRSDEIEFPIISANGILWGQIDDKLFRDRRHSTFFIFYWLEWLSMFSLLFYWSEERGSSEILITDWRNWGSTQQISSFVFSQDASGCSFCLVLLFYWKGSSLIHEGWLVAPVEFHIWIIYGRKCLSEESFMIVMPPTCKAIRDKLIQVIN